MCYLPEIETPESFKNFGYGFSALTSVCDHYNIDYIDCKEVARDIRDHLNREYQNQNDKSIRDGIDLAINFIDPLCNSKARRKSSCIKIPIKNENQKYSFIWMVKYFAYFKRLFRKNR